MATTKAKNFEEDLCRSPQKLESLFSDALICMQDDQFIDAMEVLKKLVEHDPFEKKYWIHFGHCCFKTKHYQEAVQAWAMSILIDPKDPVSHLSLARCYHALGQNKDALLAIKECKLRVSENHPLLEEINQLTQKIYGC